MIKPTVGRVVLFHPAIGSMTPSGRVEKFLTLAAIVAHVTNYDKSLYICALDEHGNPFNVESVPLIQDEERSSDQDESGMAFCEWMPYQKGQAAKTDQAVAALDMNAIVAEVLSRLPSPAPMPPVTDIIEAMRQAGMVMPAYPSSSPTGPSPDGEPSDAPTASDGQEPKP